MQLKCCTQNEMVMLRHFYIEKKKNGRKNMTEESLKTEAKDLIF